MKPAAEAFDLADWPAAILAGGLATRLRPITETIPKALVNVAGQPFLAHQLRLLHGAGVRKVVLCVGYRGEMIEEEFGEGAAFGIELKYSFDGPDLLGTGGAIKKALPYWVKDSWSYGDSYLPIDYAALARAFAQSGKHGLMTVFKNENRWEPSNVWFEADEIRQYDKRNPRPEMKHIDYGLGVLRPAAFAHRPDATPFDLADLYQDLVRQKQLAGYEVEHRFYEVGSPQGLAELDSMLRGQQLPVTP